MKNKGVTADLAWLSDQEIYQVNRIAAHSDHTYYEADEDTASDAMKLTQSLNGTWQFHYAENIALRPVGFETVTYDTSGFDHIKVPGHIQLQGDGKYGHPHYVNTMYPWDGAEALRPPHIPTHYNPVGSYVKTFEVGKELANKPTFISFQGVETAFYVWLNGQFIGYAEDSFTPSEFELTDYLQAGDNKLAVQVFRFSSASYLEDQDFWRFSGIFREVYLYAKPASHVRDLFVKTDLTSDFKSAVLTAEMDLEGDYDTQVTLRLTHAGKTIAQTDPQAADAKLSLSLSVADVALWSAEVPNLYTLFVAISKAGRLVETAKTQVGFRKFELKNKLMTLNGKRLVFKGINRHEFSARTGRAITEADMLWDIRFLKQHNLNAVRTSHYPNQSLWYKLCDRYGIYLIDEANLESHGSWQKMGACEPSWNVPGNDKTWAGAVMDRAESMLARDKNHPAILIWSCGNESYAGQVIQDMSDYFRREDPSRLVHYEGVFWNRDYDATSDMESRMYAKAAEIETYLANDPEKPYISCEYMHAMGNSLGGMRKYTDLADAYPMYQGGFIWDYGDQALYRSLPNGKEVLSYGGDFNDRVTDYNFSGNGIVFADRTISPKAQEVKYLYQNISMTIQGTSLHIKNDHLFVSTSDFACAMTLLKDGQVWRKQNLSVAVAPGDSKTITLDYGDLSDVREEVVVLISFSLKAATIWAEAGHEVAFAQAVIKEKIMPSLLSPTGMRVVYGDVNIGVHGSDFSVIFSKLSGGIVSLKYGGKELITTPPKPYYWRATTDNDRGNGHERRNAAWFAATLGQEAVADFGELEVAPDIIETPAGYQFSYAYHLAIIGTTTEVTYTIKADGAILVDVHYHGKAGLPELPVLGLNFKLLSEFDQVAYYGKGEAENYIDRSDGAKLGIYETTVEANTTPYLVPQECGNHMATRWLTVANQQGQGLKFSYTGQAFEHAVLPASPFEFENAQHQFELPPFNYTHVNIIGQQMGVGGDDSWGSPVLADYTIDSAKDLIYQFLISPL